MGVPRHAATPCLWDTVVVDVTWIPGDADVVVVTAVVLIAVTGAGWWWRATRSGASTSAPQVEDQAPVRAAADGDREPRDESPESPTGRFDRRRSRLNSGLGARLAGFFGRGELNDDAWRDLEDALLLADVGVQTTEKVLADVRTRVRDADMSPRDAVREALIAAVDPSADRRLQVGAPGAGKAAPILVVGVNGVGKTTSVGKIARVLVAEGHAVLLGAADTFRAAAADQLETWGARVGVSTVRADADGADPASVAFDAAQKGRDENVDVVLIDTAGRLQNKAGLMDQLGKIHRVVAKVAEPREVLLVIDATTGQNGLSQAKVFGEAVPLTGIVLTKMDGTAKGGIVLAVQQALGVPVKFVGLGEGADDLAPFEPTSFVDGLLGT